MNDDELRLMSYHDGELDPASHDEAKALVDCEPSARAEIARLELVAGLVRDLHAERVGAVDLTDAIVARALGSAPRRASKRAGAPLAAVPGLSDHGVHGRNRFALLGAVIAAAAMVCLFVTAYRETAPSVRIAAVPTAKPTGAIEPAREIAPIEAREAGVSIQSVDFGMTQGAIFLVSAGQSETMVVWTLEDANDKG